MSSLTPFIRHQMEDLPGPSAAPENSCSRCSPPLGKAPDSVNKPDSPDILLHRWCKDGLYNWLLAARYS